MAATCRFATVSEDDFPLKFFLFFEIISCVFILKQLFASGSVIIGEYSTQLRLGEYSPIITSPSANSKLNNKAMSAVETLYPAVNPHSRTAWNFWSGQSQSTKG